MPQNIIFGHFNFMNSGPTKSCLVHYLNTSGILVPRQPWSHTVVIGIQHSFVTVKLIKIVLKLKSCVWIGFENRVAL